MNRTPEFEARRIAGLRRALKGKKATQYQREARRQGLIRAYRIGKFKAARWSAERRQKDRLFGRPWRRKRLEKTCPNCGVQFKSRPSDQAVFCSRKCTSDSKAGKKPIHLFTQEAKRKSLAGIRASRPAAAEKLKGRTRLQPIVAKGPRHNRARHLIVSSPSREIWTIHNICDFVRKHPELFNESDVIPATNVKSPATFTCRATRGLVSLVRKGFDVKRNCSNARGTWKGWTLVSELDES